MDNYLSGHLIKQAPRMEHMFINMGLGIVVRCGAGIAIGTLNHHGRSNQNRQTESTTDPCDESMPDGSATRWGLFVRQYWHGVLAASSEMI